MALLARSRVINTGMATPRAKTASGVSTVQP